jgi:hypothetical protein
VVKKETCPKKLRPVDTFFRFLGKNGYKNVSSILLAGILDRRENSFKIQPSGGLVVVVVPVLDFRNPQFQSTTTPYFFFLSHLIHEKKKEKPKIVEEVEEVVE